MSDHSRVSFSRSRRFSLSLNTLVSIATVLALVGMINFLAYRHSARWNWTLTEQGPLAPLTVRVLESMTNEVRITVYFDKDAPLYEMCVNLLKDYANANSHIKLNLVDYIRDPGAAQQVKAAYQLSERSERDLIIFDCKNTHIQRNVYSTELSEYDYQQLLEMKGQEVKRTHFKGELLFTSALLKVTTPRSYKAYFLEGHGEHNPSAADKVVGYSQFADVLSQNALKWEKLRLEGATEVPPNSLLIVAGPRNAIAPEALEKIDRFLKQGGALLALFNNDGMYRPSGLEKVLAAWGVVVGRDVVFEKKQTVLSQDILVERFGTHPLVKPFVGQQIYMVMPRSVTNAPSRGADAPQVDILATTGPTGRIVTNVHDDGRLYETPSDFIGEVPLMAAVEKGSLRNVTADRGATRIFVAGDSYLFGNDTIDNAANRPFATHVINWLLARDDYLVAIPPRPIKEYKVTMTHSQVSAAQWILMGAFPGSVLFLGWLVWLRRRR